MTFFRKNLVLLFTLLFSFTILAQVGIGVDPPTEALDVVGNIKFTGEILPGGVPGVSGQVLTAQGAGNPTVWLTATNALFNNSFNSFGTAVTTLPNDDTFYLVPGLTNTITIAGPAKILLTTDGGILSNAGNNEHSQVDVTVVQDGFTFLTDGGYRRLFATNDVPIASWSFCIMFDAPAPGTYTWAIAAMNFSGANSESVNVSGDLNSAYQGSLHITVIYQ